LVALLVVALLVFALLVFALLVIAWSPYPIQYGACVRRAVPLPCGPSAVRCGASAGVRLPYVGMRLLYGAVRLPHGTPSRAEMRVRPDGGGAHAEADAHRRHAVPDVWALGELVGELGHQADA
jgi:hypothetical protein